MIEWYGFLSVGQLLTDIQPFQIQKLTASVPDVSSRMDGITKYTLLAFRFLFCSQRTKTNFSNYSRLFEQKFLFLKKISGIAKALVTSYRFPEMRCYLKYRFFESYGTSFWVSNFSINVWM